jgi:hypothetical protein
MPCKFRDMNTSCRRLEQTILGYLLLSIARLSNELRQLLHANRLGEVLVNASVESIRPGLAAGDAGHSTDVGRSEVVVALVFSNLGRGFEAVHDWHVLQKVSKDSSKYRQGMLQLSVPCP